MNEYLKSKTGISLTEEALKEKRQWVTELENKVQKNKSNLSPEITSTIKLLKEEIRELETSIKIRTRKIKEKSIFDIEILEYIKDIISNYYGTNYKIDAIEVKKNIGDKKVDKFAIIIASESLKQIPKYEETEFWNEVEKQNIFLIGLIRQKEPSLKAIKKVSFYENKVNNQEVVKINLSTILLVEGLYEKIMLFINSLILYKYKYNKSNLTKEEIEKIYQSNVQTNDKKKKRIKKQVV